MHAQIDYHNFLWIARGSGTFSPQFCPEFEKRLPSTKNMPPDSASGGIQRVESSVGGSRDAQNMQHEGGPHHDDGPANAISTNLHVCLLLYEAAVILPELWSNKWDSTVPPRVSFDDPNLCSTIIYNICSILSRGFRTFFRFFAFDCHFLFRAAVV